MKVVSIFCAECDALARDTKCHKFNHYGKAKKKHDKIYDIFENTINKFKQPKKNFFVYVLLLNNY